MGGGKAHQPPPQHHRQQHSGRMKKPRADRCDDIGTQLLNSTIDCCRHGHDAKRKDRKHYEVGETALFDGRSQMDPGESDQSNQR